MGERPARIPLIELKGGETLAALRGGGGAGRAGARRRQSPRPQAAEADARLDAHRATRADTEQPQGICLDSGYDNADVTRRSSAEDSPPTSAPAARRSSSRHATPAGGPALGGRSLPLLAQPQPRAACPLVKEGREPPRPPHARLRAHRLQESPRRPARPRPSGIGLKHVGQSGETSHPLHLAEQARLRVAIPGQGLDLLVETSDL